MPKICKKKINDLNYIIKTPGQQREKRVCHINMIKEYFVRDDNDDSNVSTDGIVANIVNDSNNADVDVNDCMLDSSLKDKYQSARLKNSDYLANISDKLSHLSDTQRQEVIGLLKDNDQLFPDVPTKTTAAEHDVIITTTEPIRQHPYRLNPIKLKHLRDEIQYMLDNYGFYLG